MKRKALAALLILSLTLCLCACGGEPEGIDEIVIIGEEPAAEEAAPEVEGAVIASCGDFELTESLYKLLIYKELTAMADEYGIEVKDIAQKDVLSTDGSVINACELAEINAAGRFREYYIAFEKINDYGGKIENCSGYSACAKLANEEYIAKLGEYDTIGITLQDAVLEELGDELYMYVFSLEYGEGGENAIPVEELIEIMNERVRKIEYTYLPFYDDETFSSFSADKIKELKKTSADYLKRYKNGEDFSEIVKENYLLLAGYELFFDVENTETYYSVYRDDFAEEIALCVEKLKEGEAKQVDAEYYTSVVRRLPVNENRDERWLETAMEEAYYSPYGKDFNAQMEALMLEIPEEVFTPLKSVEAAAIAELIK